MLQPEVQFDVSLKPYNTFGIDVKAKAFCTIDSLDQLSVIRELYLQYQPEILVLGGGSNVLLTKDFNGLVLLNNVKGIEVRSEGQKQVELFAKSGENWHELVMWTVNKNWGGLENLSLIPGSVGAAPIQNIGAYGVELKDVLKDVHAYHWKTGTHCVFSNKDCRFGYRNSIFKGEAKGNYFITGITLLLEKNPTQFKTSYGDIRKVLGEKGVVHPTVASISAAVINIRSSKLPDPAVLGNAGSFFKNPVLEATSFSRLKALFPDMPSFPHEEDTVKIPAAWLIERCGWKGRKVGNTGNHASQALVIVNYGGATGEEIWQHAMTVRQSVKEQFGIDLEPEVNVV
jgi:UDP-N-acetylmuramate dehydrogenase